MFPLNLKHYVSPFSPCLLISSFSQSLGPLVKNDSEVPLKQKEGLDSNWIECN